MRIHEEENRVVIDLESGDTALAAQLKVMLTALDVYQARNASYNDNWRSMGGRGVLVRIRERSERLWDRLWSRDWDDDLKFAEMDDALDLINFACFLVRAWEHGEATRDGTWWTGL